MCWEVDCIDGWVNGWMAGKWEDRGGRMRGKLPGSVRGSLRACSRVVSMSVPPLCVGEQAWDRAVARVEVVVMATEDVVLFRKISAVPESYRSLLSFVCLCPS